TLRALLQPDHRRPRLRPRRGIVDGDLVVDAVVGDAGEAFDEVQVVRRSHEIVARREIGRVDDQRISLPRPPRIPLPLADGRGQVGVAVETDDARFVYRFEHQHDVRRRLHDLVVAKRTGAGVGAAQSGYTV